MAWFARRKKPADEQNRARLAERLRQAEQRLRLLRAAARALLSIVGDLAVEGDGPAAGRIRGRISEICRRLDAGEDLAAFAEHWPADARALADFSLRQQGFIREREAELRQIIGLLGRAMAENESFNQKLFDQSERIGGLIGLDDIREIKKSLQSEVEKMRRSVAQKRDQDAQRADLLDAEVRHLKEELKKARMDGLRDGLTGLYNREALERYLDTMLKRPHEPNRRCALLLVDIDHFSKLESVYSANLRDRAVLAIAEQCREFAAHTDFLARYADGMFAVVLPAVSLREAMTKAGYLCRSIAATRYSVGEVHDAHQLSFTVSVGVGARLAGDTTDLLLSRTEKALSMAKAMGRNRPVAQRTGFFTALRARVGLA